MTFSELHAKAKKLNRNLRRQLERLRIKSTYHGDRDAALKIISKLAELHGGLRDLGWRLTDEDDGGRPSRLVHITQAWLDAQEAKKTRLDRLMERGRNGDKQAIDEAILLMASGEVD